MRSPSLKKPVFEDIKGMKFGNLTAISFEEKKHGVFLWKFKCKCGNTIVLADTMVMIGIITDCGCSNIRRDRKRHMKNRDGSNPLYKKWISMKDRCLNENCTIYQRYGGAGITICDEWVNDFDRFHKWAIKNGWEKGKTIDRINNKKGYSPQNCRWATKKQQERNKTSNVYVEYNGENKLLIEWCEIFGLKYFKTYRRIKIFGWDAEKAFFF